MTSSGASRDYVNLLPDPVNEEAFTMYVPTVEDIGDVPIFAFDGQSTAVEIPGSVIDADTLGTGFTIATWMKHDGEGNERKQQIVCAADGQGTIYIYLSHKYRIFNYFESNSLLSIVRKVSKRER